MSQELNYEKTALWFNQCTDAQIARYFKYLAKELKPFVHNPTKRCHDKTYMAYIERCYNEFNLTMDEIENNHRDVDVHKIWSEA